MRDPTPKSASLSKLRRSYWNRRYNYVILQSASKVPETCLSCGVKSYYNLKKIPKEKYSIFAEISWFEIWTVSYQSFSKFCTWQSVGFLSLFWFFFTVFWPPAYGSCVWLTHLKLDFGAHTLCVSSTHEYYSHTKYELQSPTLSGSTRHNFHKPVVKKR